MVESLENMVLEQLRAIRADLADVQVRSARSKGAWPIWQAGKLPSSSISVIWQRLMPNSKLRAIA